ncbi:MAG: cytochrome c family protein [Pseudomonadota bacterium]
MQDRPKAASAFAWLFPLFSLLFVAGCSKDASESVTVPTLSPEARLAMAPDTAKGQALFRECAVCHETQNGARHRVGPTLWGVYQQPAGNLADFRYSNALKRSGVTWTEDQLDAYIARPQSVIPGGRMSYRGMTNPADRRDLVAYLATLTDEPEGE